MVLSQFVIAVVVRQRLKLCRLIASIGYKTSSALIMSGESVNKAMAIRDRVAVGKIRIVKAASAMTLLR